MTFIYIFLFQPYLQKCVSICYTLYIFTFIAAANPVNNSYLQDIERPQLDPAPLLRAVDLGTLNDDRVGGKVDAPRQRRRGHEHLDVTVSEQILHKGSVNSGKQA